LSETWPDCEWMGLLGRWRIFTQREEGSPSIGVGTSTGWIASANWRRNWIVSGKSSTKRGKGVVGAEPAGTSSTARREVSRSCRRTTVSRAERSVKRGERILMRRPETAGIEAARRNWIFCCLSYASREGEDAAVGGAGPAERSSRCCEASWYMRPTATHEVGMSRRTSGKPDYRSTGRGVMS
jgi:hypothetical protein